MGQRLWCASRVALSFDGGVCILEQWAQAVGSNLRVGPLQRPHLHQVSKVLPWKMMCSNASGAHGILRAKFFTIINIYEGYDELCHAALIE